MERDALIERLQRVIEAHEPRIRTAYVFGSWARGTARPDSDVDVGVVFETPQPRTLMGLPTELEASLGASLDMAVQVVDLSRASADLVHRVFRDGHILVDRDRSARIRFEVYRRNQYFDLLPHLERYRRGA